MPGKRKSAKPKKTWGEKLRESKDLPQTLVIPAPMEVSGLMERIPKGRITTIAALGKALARRHGTSRACPMTTGIFAWIAAHAAEEAREAGHSPVVPWWRTLKSDGSLNPKYPGGTKRQRALLESEGHTVVRRKGTWVVRDHEDAVAVPVTRRLPRGR